MDGRRDKVTGQDKNGFPIDSSPKPEAKKVVRRMPSRFYRIRKKHSYAPRPADT